jgi:hypothetical protein
MNGRENGPSSTIAPHKLARMGSAPRMLASFRNAVEVDCRARGTRDSAMRVEHLAVGNARQDTRECMGSSAHTARRHPRTMGRADSTDGRWTAVSI